MHESVGVLSAIQSLAGVYIYDYTKSSAIRKRVNDRFSQAEARLTHLLNDPASLKDGSEIITIASILSMQDVSTWTQTHASPSCLGFLEPQ